MPLASQRPHPWLLNALNAYASDSSMPAAPASQVLLPVPQAPGSTVYY